MNSSSTEQHGEKSFKPHNASGSADGLDAQPRKGWNSGGRGSRGGGADEGKGGSGIIRVSQACTNCRRMKMRCVNADNPPCKRCAHFGEECVVGQLTRRRATARTRQKDSTNVVLKNERRGSSAGFDEESQRSGKSVPQDRIGELEHQVGSMQSTLKDILAALQGGPLGVAQGHAVPEMPWSSSEEASTSQAYGDHGRLPTVSRLSSFAQQPSPSNEIAGSIENMVSQQVLGTSILPHAFSQKNEGDFVVASGCDWLSRPKNLNQPGIEPVMENRDSQLLASVVQPDTQAAFPRDETNSQSPSEDEDEDPLAPDHIAAPLSTMADLAEVAVERANLEENERSDDRHLEMTEMSRLEDGPSKKRKLSRSITGNRFSTMDGLGLRPSHQSHSVGRVAFASPGYHSDELDVVNVGLVTETEAQQLFHLFFQGCNTFIPIFDTLSDTWESLRDRSPLLLTTIIGIGARVRDGGGPVSDTQRQALAHARQLASATLFSLNPTAETVQAMILLATYDDHGRIPASHARALAMAIGLDKCLTQLLRTGMGSGLSQDQMESERHLVMGSRIILYLFQLEHQLAFGTGRPALFRNDLGIDRCREFLLHPLSVSSDVRLVSTVEMMSLRAPLHVLLTNSPEQPLNEETIAKLREANASFERWLMHWDGVFAETFAQEQGDFYRESLVAQREYASLFTNSQLLRGVRSAEDVKRMPSDKRELALRAMNNAQNCIRIALRGKSYGRAFKFAVHYTHVCVAFAASFLIRIARLFPRELDLRQSAKDVEELATLLAQVPAGRYARSLRLILRRARKQHVMPLPSRASSPLRTAPLPSYRHQVFAPLTSTENMNAPKNTFSSHIAMPSTDGMGFFETSLDQESYQYDFDFAQELWERAGLTDGNDSLPLFLDGESLGDTLNASFALEDFFVPPELDMRFNHLGVFPQP